jgi:hypothetical protein
MRRVTAIAVAIMMITLIMVPASSYGQSYEKLSKAIAKLDSTLKVMVESQKAKQPAQQLADAEGMGATPARPAADIATVYEFAGNLQDVVAQLQGVVTEAKEAEKSRPQNPTSTGHGKIALTGLFHQQYYSREGSAKASTFDTKYMLFGASGALNQWAKVSFLGNFAKTPTLLDAYATFTPSKYWAIDFGQFKAPFGTEFLKSPSVYPFASTFKALSYGTGRDVGADISLNYQWKNGNAVKLTGGVFNGAGTNVTDANTDKNFVGRVEMKFAKMFTLAPNLIAGKTNDPDSTKKNLDAWGSSFNWSWKNEIVEAEYVHNQTGSVEKQGWYLWGGHTFATGLKLVPELQVLARYEQMDPNLNKSGDGSDRITIGTNLYIDKKFTKLQINYQINGEQSKSIDNNEWLLNLQLAF